MNLLAPTVFALGCVAIAFGVGLKLLLSLAGTVEWDRDGPVFLGVCRRMARRLGVPVRGVRILTVATTIVTGVVPGIVGYVVAAVILGRDGRRPATAASRAELLGICAGLARRLDVPVDNVRIVVIVATLFTGVVPGMLVYFLVGVLKAILPASRLGDWLGQDWMGGDGASWSRSRSWSPTDAPADGEIPGRIGRYRIVGLLGRGGMGSVWRGRDEALGRDAAVKVIDGPFGSDAVRRFGEEARAAAALASPHIVQVWEYAPEARPPFLAMEYVPGKSLANLVRSGGPQPVATVLDCARQVLAGLATAHAAGIVHRDIKPANILLATTGPAAGTYKLTDFGLATSPDRGHAFTATGTLLGTLSYMAPEVAMGDDATPSSDLHALGATLHEMLTGRPPFAADTPLKLLRRITTESIPPIGTLRPDLPADLSAWLDRLVARDRADRFPSADAALAAFGDVEGARQATTDLDRVGVARDDAAVPWHHRPAPGSPSHPRARGGDRLRDVLGRAMAFEADGRDPLGEDSVLDIARELNVDTAAVRAAIEESRRGRGGGVTQVFRRALGGGVRTRDRGASFGDDPFLGAGSRRRPGSWEASLLAATIVAALVATAVVKASRETWSASSRESDARHDPGVAELPPAPDAPAAPASP